MGKRIAGVCYVKVDGEQLELEGSLTCSLDFSEKEGLAGLSGVAGYKETPVVPYIEGDFFVPPGFPLAKLRDLTDATITAELANGMTGVLSGAWLAGKVEVDAAEGKAKLKFEGVKGEWI